jgi:outer membrane PBP1 activator LpoA protein
MPLPDRTGRRVDRRQGLLPMQAKVRLARNLVVACLLAALAAACQIPGLQAESGPEAAAERALRQSREGDHAAAARSYESAARQALEADRNAYWLAAAGSWVRGGDLAAAETALAQLTPPIRRPTPASTCASTLSSARARRHEARRGAPARHPRRRRCRGAGHTRAGAVRQPAGAGGGTR